MQCPKDASGGADTQRNDKKDVDCFQVCLLHRAKRFIHFHKTICKCVSLPVTTPCSHLKGWLAMASLNPGWLGPDRPPFVAERMPSRPRSAAQQDPITGTPNEAAIHDKESV
jgi:hypothetical protein